MQCIVGRDFSMRIHLPKLIRCAGLANKKRIITVGNNALLGKRSSKFGNAAALVVWCLRAIFFETIFGHCHGLLKIQESLAWVVVNTVIDNMLHLLLQLGWSAAVCRISHR